MADWIDNLSDDEADALYTFKTKGVDALSDPQVEVLYKYKDQLKGQPKTTSFAEDLTKGLQRGVGSVRRGLDIAAGGLATAFGNIDSADKIYSQSDADYQQLLKDTAPSGEQGLAGKIVSGIGSTVPVVAASMLGGAPLLAATAGMQAIPTGADLVNQGVDASTAGKVAAVQAGANMVFGTVPSIGVLAKNLYSIPAGAAANAIAGGIADSASQIALQRAGYEEQAKQFNPTDLSNRAVDAAIGALFGIKIKSTSPQVGRNVLQDVIRPENLDKIKDTDKEAFIGELVTQHMLAEQSVREALVNEEATRQHLDIAPEGLIKTKTAQERLEEGYQGMFEKRVASFFERIGNQIAGRESEFKSDETGARSLADDLKSKVEEANAKLTELWNAAPNKLSPKVSKKTQEEFQKWIQDKQDYQEVLGEVKKSIEENAANLTKADQERAARTLSRLEEDFPELFNAQFKKISPEPELVQAKDTVTATKTFADNYKATMKEALSAIQQEMESRGKPLFQSFEDFSNRLPPEYLHKANELWTDVLGNTLPKELKDITPQEKEQLVLTELKKKDNLSSEFLSKFGDRGILDISNQRIEDAIQKTLSDTQNSVTGVTKKLVGGGQMLGLLKNNPLLRALADRFNGAERLSSAAVYRDWTLNLSKRFHEMPKTDARQIMEVMQQNEGKRYLTDAELRELGFSEQQRGFYLETQRVFQDWFKKINDTRVAAGMEALQPRPGYFPSRWRGDFYIKILNKDGDLVKLVDSNNKQDLKLLVDRLKIENPKYKYGEIEQRKTRRNDTSVYDGMDILKNMAEGEEAAKISALIEQYSKEQFYKKGGFDRHFNQKKGIEGAYLDKEGQLDINKMSKALELYINQAAKWVEFQALNTDIQKVTNNSKLRSANPTLMRYVDDYIKLNLNGQEAINKASKVDEGITEMYSYISNKLGFGEKGAAGVRQDIQGAKNLITRSMLNWVNPKFLYSQFIQPYTAIAPMLSFVKARFPEANLSLAMARSAEIFLTPSKENLNSFNREAFDYAKKNGLIESDFENLSEHTKGFFTKVTGEDMVVKFEERGRAIVYMTLANALRTVKVDGESIPRDIVYKTAANLTDVALVNYRPGERAMIYHNLGLFGNLASGLQTFKHNDYGQLALYTKEALQNKAFAPMAMSLIMKVTVAGATGMYAFDDADKFLKIVSDGKLSLKRMLLEMQGNKTFTDFVTYGLPSAWAGADLSSTVSSSRFAPDMKSTGIMDMLAAVNPIAGKIIDVGVESTRAAKTLLKEGDLTSLDKGQLAKAILPQGVAQGVADLYFNTKGNTVYSPSKDGVNVRTQIPADQSFDRNIIKSLGFSPLRETRESSSAFEARLLQQAQNTQKKDILNRLERLSLDGKQNTIAYQELFDKYVKLGGDAQSLGKNLVKAYNQSPLDRAVPSKGYTRGNTEVMDLKNTFKQNVDQK